MKKLWLVCLALLGLTTLAAQRPNPGREVKLTARDSLFEFYYLRTIEVVRKMYISKRGVDLDGCDTGRWIEKGFYIQRLRGMLFNRKDQEVGFCLYHFEGDVLHIFLMKYDSLYYHQQVVPKAHLTSLEQNLRKTLGVDALTAARSAIPKTKGWEKRQKRSAKNLRVGANNKSHLDQSKLIDSLTDILLPKAIRPGLAGMKHLIIQPEFNIGLVPICMLKPYESGAYLIDSFGYSFCPHVCNFEKMKEDREGYGSWSESYNSDKSFLVVGDPKYSDKKFAFPPLPGAAQEADSVASLLGTTAMKGADATYSKVVRRADGAKLIYLATHGYFDFDKLLENSFIALAPDEKNADGFWTAKEIQRDHLTARLVVLSACQTGVGKVYEGGFIQTGRSFFMAGVDNVVCSLWSVDDEATRDLMIAFMKNLKESGQWDYPAWHLHKAMVEIKKKYPDPSKWAAFTVYGFSYL